MKRLNSEQWRAAKHRDGAVLLKSMDTEVTQTDASSRVLNFVISTETVDSYNDVVKADGWDLDRFMKNPVVLWAHDSRQPPVGKALTIGVNDKKLVSSAEFADAETYAFADTIFRLLKGKFLRATSVGFFPKEWNYDEERGGFNLIKNELFEFSIVPVPANPDALGAAVKSGIDCQPLREWAERTLDLWEPVGDHDPSPVAIWVPKAQIESVYKSLSKTRVVSILLDEGDAPGEDEEADSGTAEIDLDGTEVEESDVIEESEAEAEETETEEAEERALSDAFIDRLPMTVATMSDEIESLKAQIDQLMARQHQQEEEAAVVLEEDAGVLSSIIDIQFDSADVEDEVSRSIVDLEIDPEELQNCIRRQLEKELMKNTGKLPREV